MAKETFENDKDDLTEKQIPKFSPKLSSRGGLEVELWTDNSLPSASVDRIPLWAL